MTSALITVAPKLEKLIPLLASDKDGEVIATARAITRTLAQAGADWHDLVKALARTEPLGTVEPVCWRDLPESEQAGWLAQMRVSRRLSAWECDFCASILAQVRFREHAHAEADRDTRRLHLQVHRGGAAMSATIIRLPTRLPPADPTYLEVRREGKLWCLDIVTPCQGQRPIRSTVMRFSRYGLLVPRASEHAARIGRPLRLPRNGGAA